MSPDPDHLRRLIRDIPDWPQPGITFRDITPLVGDAEAFGDTIDGLVDAAGERTIHQVLGVEARGFVFAAPVAHVLGAGFVPVRKPGKLPHEIERQEYELEYGTSQLEIHRDAVLPGQSVLIVDDVLATGGTAAATVRLVERLGGRVAALVFVIELDALGGRSQLLGHEIHSLVHY
jgi:adenine phosphoribosyltransferase